jgi:UDP-N-acetyl-D-glucosamine dehydrogenase
MTSIKQDLYEIVDCDLEGRDRLEVFLERIAARNAVVAVIGLGYVGLPLAVSFAEAGLRTVGIDLDERRVAMINRGESPVSDVAHERVSRLVAAKRRSNGTEQATNGHHKNGHAGNGHATNGHATNGHGANGHATNGRASNDHRTNGQGSAGLLSATTDYDLLYGVDAVVICVPTPLTTNKDPDVSAITSAADEVAQRLHPGMLVVLESTTYPGTTEELMLPRLCAAPLGTTDGLLFDEPVGDRCFLPGEDFFLAFSPERIDPGRTDWTVRNTPKVVGGVTPRCLEAARALYACAVEQTVPVSLPRTAEMVKLLENTFRALNIALANEMAIMCDRLGIDVWEVIEAAKTKPFGYMPFYPGPGLGGHCIPVDPHYLAWKLRTLDYSARTIQLASEINHAMPGYVASMVGEALNDKGKAFRGSRVLVLGVAYKPNVGDMRESPALDLIKVLLQKGADVVFHDPYASRIRVSDQVLDSIELDEAALAEADCVVVHTNHATYDWSWVMEHSAIVIDTRNATAGIAKNGAKVVKL